MMKSTSLALGVLAFAVLAAADASDYDNLCMPCVFNDNYYCLNDNKCKETDADCANPLDISDGCPTNLMCSVGNGGEIFIGDETLAGGYP